MHAINGRRHHRLNLFLVGVPLNKNAYGNFPKVNLAFGIKVDCHECVKRAFWVWNTKLLPILICAALCP